MHNQGASTRGRPWTGEPAPTATHDVPISCGARTDLWLHRTAAAPLNMFFSCYLGRPDRAAARGYLRPMSVAEALGEPRPYRRSAAGGIDKIMAVGCQAGNHERSGATAQRRGRACDLMLDVSHKVFQEVSSIGDDRARID
jgi:hypothetical protein